MKSGSCQSCMMPFDKDPGTRESDQYCSLCFKNGKFVYEGNDVKVFREMSYHGMRSRGMNPIKAWLFSRIVRFAPRWRKA